MGEKRNFVVTVKEPANGAAPNGVGVALQFEFHETVQGIGRNTFNIMLAPTATMADAEELARLLNALGQTAYTS